MNRLQRTKDFYFMLNLDLRVSVREILAKLLYAPKIYVLKGIT